MKPPSALSPTPRRFKSRHYGKWIDRFYLDSIGWRGIRQRKLHIEELLRKTVSLVTQSGLQVHVVDIAAGHGRYVLEALIDSKVRPDSIWLRDYGDINVKDGGELIRAKGLAQSTLAQRDRHRYTIAARYFAGVAFISRDARFWLLWPSCSLATVASRNGVCVMRPAPSLRLTKGCAARCVY
ncbi:MAG: class I SAM-dependent methyltransferase family protein [Gammaproteobacteria bacterium]